MRERYIAHEDKQQREEDKSPAQYIMRQRRAQYFPRVENATRKLVTLRSPVCRVENKLARGARFSLFRPRHYPPWRMTRHEAGSSRAAQNANPPVVPLPLPPPRPRFLSFISPREDPSSSASVAGSRTARKNETRTWLPRSNSRVYPAAPSRVGVISVP